MTKDKTIKFSLPTRVVDSNRDLTIFKSLLKEKEDQIFLKEKEMVILNPGDYFILDFGEEKCGGIRIVQGFKDSTNALMSLHIRFGESISEASSNLGENGSCNDHSLRDFKVSLPALSDQIIGDTGFRFVRIDVLKGSIINPIKSIYSYEYINNFKQIKKFDSKNQKLKDIFDTCKHTIDLCMQHRIWDGVKRDRLVWIGDMEPEIHAILHLYGNINLVKKTMETAMESNPMPCFINDIPSYSAWFLLIMYDMWKVGKEEKFIKDHQNYMNHIIEIFDKSTDTDDLDFDKSHIPTGMKYFIDWPTYREDNESERKAANVLLLQYILPKTLEMYDGLNLDNRKLEKLINKILAIKVEVPKTKAFAAFYQLVYKDKKSLGVILGGETKGFSTFLSYYILKAISLQNPKKAIELLEKYYGGMLDLGATSFFEDFDLEFAKNCSRIDEVPNSKKDFHKEYGNHCYKGYRHSLCHGWSVGPISFLLEEIK